MMTQTSGEDLDLPKGKRVYIQTFGCQMNEYDSAKLLEQLRGEDYYQVDSPNDADLILVNTCAIREKAEHKVYSLLGRLGELKKERPELVIGVGGCVSQQKGEELARRAPEVDLVFGPDHIFDIIDMIDEVEAGTRPVRTEWRFTRQRVANFIPNFSPETAPAGEIKAGLVITKGCNNYCTFCVVPYTRGREVSREPENIVAEARAMAERGVREITLLGQNVNSYKANGVSFVKLLEQLDGVEDLARIRYTSPHPKDLNPALAEAHARLASLCEHMHLPVQSGSNTILKAMRRNHTIEAYLDKVEMLRRHVPDMALSTDIIVGFPGETDEDFEATLDVMRKVRFDQVYAFKFSPRSDTPATHLPDQVPEAVRAERLTTLFALQDGWVAEVHARMIGSRQEVLVEGPHPLGGGALTGRTRGNKPVLVEATSAEPGDLLTVDVIGARKYSLVAQKAPRGSCSVYRDEGASAGVGSQHPFPDRDPP